MRRFLSPFARALAVVTAPVTAAGRRLGRWLSPPRTDAWEGDGVRPRVAEGLVARVGALTDTGRQRKHNEDRPLVQRLGGRPLEVVEDVTFDLSDGGIVLAVCDGMGGAAAGEVASAIVVETLSERTSELASEASAPDSLVPWLVEGVEESNRRALHRVDEDPGLQGMGSTVTSAVLKDTGMILAHVGDSRGYHLHGGRLRQITEDHSFVAKLVALGRISEEEAREHSQRNLLLQAVGTGGELEVERTAHELHTGDRVLLCSDGLTTLVSDEEILEIVAGDGGPSAQCAALVEMANARGGHDNITVVVAHLEASPGGKGDAAGEPAVPAVDR